ncbi:MAG: hypothetical protein AMJ46_13035 [Latescibacteria bacterium DG_63]|nr:MAG: hypothetical protein AMJ46_13035 [Latescibacteria bacterium DG_63]
MKHGGFLKSCVVLALVSIVCSLGCAHTMSSESTRIRQASWQATLDDCQEVRLSFHRVHDRSAGEPGRTYDQLTLELRPRSHLQSESLLKSIGLKPGVERGQFRFGDIEVRADESRRRVWFADREAGRVVATLDRDTGLTTGPDDEPPVWATVNGGVLLEEQE